MGHTTLLDGEMAFAHIPPKAEDLHKGSAGRLLIVAGSRPFCGAAAMACMGALRCGCGYVTLASTPYVCGVVAHHLVEPTFLLLEESPEGRVSGRAAELILEKAAGYDALLFGCGLGCGDDTTRLTREILLGCDKPVVLDADGINAASRDISMVKGARSALVLTPHEGEMARLAGITVAQVHADRLGAATAFARENGVCVVLKGPGTLVAPPCGETLKNRTGNSGLAKAGSGDVLSGMIGSLAAQGLDPFWAAACGVYLHGAAADITARRLSRFCMQPTDLLDALPEIFLKNGR